MAGEAVGEALAPGVGLGQLVLVAPAAVVDHVIDVGAVGALGVAEDPQRRRLEIATVLGLIAQRVLAHEIALDGFVGGGGEERGLGQQLDLQRQEIAEDSRQRDDHVDPRMIELVERDQCRAGEAAVAVEAGSGADQGQRLGDRPTLALEVVGAPQDQSDRFGEGIAIGHVPRQQPGRLARPIPDGEGTGNSERIEAVQVSAGRQDRRRAKQVAARRRADETTVQRAEDGRDLVVLGEQPVGRRQLPEQGDGFLVGGHAADGESRLG